MADDKTGRNKQADDRDRRQRAREVTEARDRADEAEPPETEPPREDPASEGEKLGDLDDALEAHTYPTTADELIEAHGDHEVESQDGLRSLEDVLDADRGETFDSADDVRERIRRDLHRE